MRTRDLAIERVHTMDAAPAELAAIAEAERNLAELGGLERACVEAAEHGDRQAAQQILYGPD